MRAYLVLVVVLCGSTSFAADGQWHWVKANNIVAKGWDVSGGTALVSIDGTKFSAKLFWKDSDNKLQILLDGTIKNGRISARETIQESDYTGSVFHGTFARKHWTFSGTTGAESITLSDGWNMIAITRDLH